MRYDLDVYKKYFKKRNGITLIALVVTIIVLLIILSISLAKLTGDNGLITQAKRARLEANRNGILERIEVVELAVKGEGNGALDVDKFEEELRKAFENDSDIDDDDIVVTPNIDDGTCDVKVGDVEVEILIKDITIGDEKFGPGKTATGGNVEYDGAIIPEGFTVSNIEGEKTVANGLVIYDIPEADLPSVDWTKTTTDINGQTILEVQTKYNQFVWIPVPNYSKFDYIILTVQFKNFEFTQLKLYSPRNRTFQKKASVSCFFCVYEVKYRQ